MADAARSDLVAVTVEERHRQFRLLEPVVIRRFPERRDGEREHQDQPAGREREPLRDRFDQNPPPPAGDVEAVHEHGEPLVKLAAPGLRDVDAGVDARVEVEQDAAQPRLPVLAALALVEQIAQSAPRGITNRGRSPGNGRRCSLSRLDPAGLWRHSHKVNGKRRSCECGFPALRGSMCVPSRCGTL